MKISGNFVLLTVIIFACSTHVVAQGEPPAPRPISKSFLGSTENGAYKNEFFGVKVNVPAEMHVLTRQEQTDNRDSGAKMLSKAVEGDQDAWERAAKAEVLILSVSELNPGTGPSASLNVGVIRQPPETTSKEVADTTKNFLLRNPGISVVSNTKDVKFAERDFSMLELKVKTEGATVEIRYYVTIVRGYSMTFVVTYLEKQQCDRFEKVLATLEFSN